MRSTWSRTRAALKRYVFARTFLYRTGCTQGWVRRTFARLVELHHEITGDDPSNAYGLDPIKLRGPLWPPGQFVIYFGGGSHVFMELSDGLTYTINENYERQQLYVHERAKGQDDWVEAYRENTHLTSTAWIEALKEFESAVDCGVLVQVTE